MLGFSMIAALTLTAAEAAAEKQTIAAIDTAYQAAVERNDADAMAKILHDDFILVVGRGEVFTREDLLRSAREAEFVYDAQVEDAGTQTVRLYGRDTAIVTALLYIKATRNTGEKIDKRLWFSDTYVRTKEGWRYAFGQASMALPAK